MIQNAIVINSLPRSGSNIIWNIVGSSPQVQMTKEEFHVLTGFNKVPSTKILMRLNALVPGIPVMYGHIRETLDQSARRAAAENTQLFEMRGIDAAGLDTLCFKVMGPDNRFNPLIQRCFDQVRFINLVRDGAGICDSYCRRGLPPEHAAHMYKATINRMRRNQNSIWIKFEDLIDNVPGTIDGLYSALSLQKPLDDFYLYKPKGFGPGEEQSSKDKHEKILCTPGDLHKHVQGKTRAEYLADLPSAYWQVFYTITAQTMLDLGYDPY